MHHNAPSNIPPGPNPGDRFQEISKDICCLLGRCRCHQRRNGPGGSTWKASSPKPPQCPKKPTTPLESSARKVPRRGTTTLWTSEFLDKSPKTRTEQLNPGLRPTLTEIQSPLQMIRNHSPCDHERQLKKQQKCVESVSYKFGTGTPPIQASLLRLYKQRLENSIAKDWTQRHGIVKFFSNIPGFQLRVICVGYLPRTPLNSSVRTLKRTRQNQLLQHICFNTWLQIQLNVYVCMSVCR